MDEASSPTRSVVARDLLLPNHVTGRTGQAPSRDTPGQGRLAMDEVTQGLSVHRCGAPGCRVPARTAGYCPKHYQQVRRHGRLTPEREYQPRRGHCNAAGCSKQQIAKGLCFRHYQQTRRYGRLTPERERTYRRAGCQVPGCGDPHSSRGYCKRHYMSEYYLPRRSSQERPGRQRAKAA